MDSINQSREIVLDTETTGLDPKSGHRIIEIGAVEVINRMPTGKFFHKYINPERKVDPGAYKIHGISDRFLLDKPLFKNIYKDFLTFIEGATLVIHNASFDVKFLNHEFTLVSSDYKISFDNVVDTLKIARKKFPGQRASLDALCRKFKIDNSDRELHGALKDAKLLLNVYFQLVTGSQINFKIERNSNKDIDSNNKIYNNNIIFPSDAEKELHNDLLNAINS